MAIAPKDVYPKQVVTDDADYPQGKARNVVAIGDGTGTPFEQAWLNDIWGFLQAILDEVGASPSGTPDKVGASQYLSAIQEMIGNEAESASQSFANISAALAIADAAVDLNGQRVTNIGAPSVSSDAVTKAHADARGSKDRFYASRVSAQDLTASEGYEDVVWSSFNGAPGNAITRSEDGIEIVVPVSASYKFTVCLVTNVGGSWRVLQEHPGVGEFFVYHGPFVLSPGFPSVFTWVAAIGAGTKTKVQIDVSASGALSTSSSIYCERLWEF